MIELDAPNTLDLNINQIAVRIKYSTIAFGQLRTSLNDCFQVTHSIFQFSAWKDA